ncbi:MAG: hypothetical protein KBC53_07855 [Nitrosomonas sp.]|nr:hypothetical protein [Nitrosomonas sp.]
MSTYEGIFSKILREIYDLNQEIDMVNMINTAGSSEQEKKDLYVKYRILCLEKDRLEKKLEKLNTDYYKGSL